MDKMVEELYQHMDAVEQISNKIEQNEAYMEELRTYLPLMNQIMTTILGPVQNPEISLDLNPDFLMQVLSDIIYGIENEDSVFLLDVLRYGLLEIYDYVATELQGGACYE